MRSYVYVKICRLRFPWPYLPKSLMGYISLGLRNLTHICFVAPCLVLMTQNVSILPSDSLHQKYIGFVSLSLIGLKV